MKKATRSTLRFCALVKFEVSAMHFTPAYSFETFLDTNSASLAATITDAFSDKIDEAISYQDYTGEDLANDRAKLDKRLCDFNKRLTSHDTAQIDGCSDSMDVGYSTYTFQVLAASPVNQFAACALSALQEDFDFSEFIEFQIDNIETDAGTENAAKKELLALEFLRLISLSATELASQNIFTFLNEVEQLVVNDEM